MKRGRKRIRTQPPLDRALIPSWYGRFPIDSEVRCASQYLSSSYSNRHSLVIIELLLSHNIRISQNRGHKGTRRSWTPKQQKNKEQKVPDTKIKEQTTPTAHAIILRGRLVTHQYQSRAAFATGSTTRTAIGRTYMSYASVHDELVFPSLFFFASKYASVYTKSNVFEI